MSRNNTPWARLQNAAAGLGLLVAAEGCTINNPPPVMVVPQAPCTTQPGGIDGSVFDVCIGGNGNNNGNTYGGGHRGGGFPPVFIPGWRAGAGVGAGVGAGAGWNWNTTNGRVNDYPQAAPHSNPQPRVQPQGRPYRKAHPSADVKQRTVYSRN